MRLRRLGSGVLLIAASTVFALLLGEFAVRLFSPQFLRPMFREQVDGAIHTRAGIKARMYSPGEFDTRVTTSEQRFRSDRIYTEVPPEGTLRIAVLGDSYVFGTGAEDEESYPAHLESLLAHVSFPRVEVLNAGIHGSGIGDHAIWYDRWVSRFRPGLVVLTVFGGNDIQDEIDQPRFKPGSDGTMVPLSDEELVARRGFLDRVQRVVARIPGYHYLTQHSHLLYALRSMVSSRQTRMEQDVSGRYAEETAAIERIAGELRWLHARVRQDDARLAVVFIPSLEAVLENEGRFHSLKVEQEFAERLSQEAGSADIPFLDLTPILTGRQEQHPASFYFQRDPHMRPEGYRLVARAVRDHLQSAGLLTPGSLPRERRGAPGNPGKRSMRNTRLPSRIPSGARIPGRGRSWLLADTPRRPERGRDLALAELPAPPWFLRPFGP
jgi:lysophospholipase L1-like esterase